MDFEKVYKISFGVAALDLFTATICAANGDSHFVFFIVLAGFMWAQGCYFKVKADNKTGE